jgi:hypothetical protein
MRAFRRLSTPVDKAVEKLGAAGPQTAEEARIFALPRRAACVHKDAKNPEK